VLDIRSDDYSAGVRLVVPCTRMLSVSRSHLRASKFAVVASTLSPSGRNLALLH